MLRFITRNIIIGLVTILPVLLTIYLLYWLAISAEALLGDVMRIVLPENMYRPGMGLFTALIVVFMSGLLMRAYFVQRLFSQAEQIFYHMPLVRPVYRAIRDFFDYFSPIKQREFEQVVVVTFGETNMKLIGFVTQAIPENMPEGLRDEDSILVYLPLSYMIGGYAVLIPRSAVKPVDMNMEEAMRFTLSAGVTK